MPLKVILSAFQVDSWFQGDLSAMMDLFALAERLGVDGVHFSEHVVMGEDIAGYPYSGTFDPASDFLEPMALMAAFAARTQRVILTTGILLAPLRSAVLLAKQAATVDLLSNGRLELGLGVGWQKAEYDFSGVPWNGRYGRLIETVEAIRQLWKHAPATYHGKHVTFDRAYSKPFPAQASGIPIFFGIGPSDLNIERIALHADGWTPSALPPEAIRTGLDKIHARMETLGRDPRTMRVRTNAILVHDGDGTVNLDASIDALTVLKNAGVDEVIFPLLPLCKGPEDFEAVTKRIILGRDALG